MPEGALWQARLSSSNLSRDTKDVALLDDFAICCNNRMRPNMSVEVKIKTLMVITGLVKPPSDGKHQLQPRPELDAALLRRSVDVAHLAPHPLQQLLYRRLLPPPLVLHGGSYEAFFGIQDLCLSAPPSCA